MQRNAITEALERIITSQRKIEAIALSLRREVHDVGERGDITEAFTLKNELKGILRIMKRLETCFQELENVRVSRMKRATTQQKRQQCIN